MADDWDYIENYVLLAEDVIREAMRDYITARKTLMANGDNYRARTTLAETRAFFRSDWFDVLSLQASGEGMMRTMDALLVKDGLIQDCEKQFNKIIVR